MHLDKDPSVTIFMAVILLTLVIFSVLGNGFVLGIIVRFKKLRTYPNILLANLALVDLLNALINMPIYLLYGILEVGWFKGKTWAILSSFISRLFVLLNLASMLLLLVNIFLALTLDLRYFTWKTKEKALIIVLLEWFICIASVSLFSIPLFFIDLQDALVFRYRQMIFLKYKLFLAGTVGVFIASALVFGVLTCFSVRRRNRQRKHLNLPQLQAEARLRMDIQAAKTVAMVVIAYIVCYLPVIAAAGRGREYSDSVIAWLEFVPNISIFISSGINPIMYCFRTRRFRSALKQLFKDPCGGSYFQETEARKNGKQPAPRIQNKVTIQATAKNNIQPTTITKHTDFLEGEECAHRGVIRLRRNALLTLSFQELNPEGVVKLAWVEKHNADSQGESSVIEEESSTPCADFTKKEVIVEVHTPNNNNTV